MKHIVLVIMLHVAATAESRAEVPACKEVAELLGADIGVSKDLPPGLVRFELDGTRVEGLTWEKKWDQALLDALKAKQADAAKTKKSVVLTAIVKGSDDKECSRKVLLGTSQGSGKTGNTDDLKNTLPDCRIAGEQWNREVLLQVPNRRFTILVFYETGEICYANRLQGVMGDPIYVGFYSDPEVAWKPLELAPCSLQDASPALFTGGDVSLTVPIKKDSKDPYRLIRSAPRTCFNDHVDIKLEGSLGEKTLRAGISLQQYSLYRATLQVGALFSTRHTDSFDLATDAAGTSTIRSTGDRREGPEFVATLVLYGVPRYFEHLVGDGPSYRGRDILNDQGLLDRIGLVTGIGVQDPSRRFVLGASFEVLYGFNVIVVEDFHRQRRLDGVAVGDVFMGEASTIPTKNVWQHEIVFGISLDVRYVKELFGGHIR